MTASFDRRSSSFARSLSAIHIRQPSHTDHPFRQRRSPTSAAAKSRPTSSSHGITITAAAATPLPFSRDSGVGSRHESLHGYPSKKKKRSSSPRLTADMAYEMVTKLTSEKKQENKLLRCSNNSMDDTKALKNCVGDNNDKPTRRRRATVSFVPSSQQQQPTTATTSTPPFICNSTEAAAAGTTTTRGHQGFRQDYILGETIRSSSHMIIEPTSKRATDAIDSLQKHDFAFVKRSDGSFSYAILAYRSMEPVKGRVGANGTNKSSSSSKKKKKDDTTMEECLVFLMNDICYTKIVRRSRWSEYVRLASTKEEEYSTSHHDDTIVVESTPISDNCEPSLILCQEIFSPPVVLPQEMEVGGGAKYYDELPPSMISFDRQLVEDEECSVISNVSDSYYNTVQ